MAFVDITRRNNKMKKLTLAAFSVSALYCFAALAAEGLEPQGPKVMFNMVGYGMFAALFTLAAVLTAISIDKE